MRNEMAMPMPGNLPENWEDKNEKDENDEIEKGQENESWAKEAWNVFKNKLDDYKNSDLAIGMKMYASDTVDFVKSKVEALSKSDRLTFLNGLAREGNYIVGAKNDLMENISNNFSYNFKNEEIQRFFHNSADIFKEEKEKNYEAISKIENGEAKDLERIKGVGTGTGTLIKYAKLTVGATTPLGGALMGTMAAGHLSEVAKKTRLQAEKVIEKTRVGQLDENGKLIDEDDFDRAWDEAYRLYDEAAARSKDGEVTVKDLDKIYQENLPKDVLGRIERNENYEGLNILQKGMILNMKKCAEKVEAEFVEIENSDKTAEEKEAGKQAILERNKKLLTELDGMVSDQGIVDTYAYLARAGEKTGKAATLAVTTIVGGKGLHKMYESLKEINLDRLTENVVSLGKHFKEYAGKAYDIIGPNKLGAEETNFTNQHMNLSSYDQTNMKIRAEIEQIRKSGGGEARIKELRKIQLELLEAEKAEVEKNSFKTLQEKIDGAKNPEEKLRYIKEAGLSDVEDKSVKASHEIAGAEKNAESQIKVSGQNEKPNIHHFTVDETIKTKHGGSIWSQIRHNLEKDDEFKKLSKELQIKNINLVKNHILNDPNSFLSKEELTKLSKLEKDFDPKKMLAKEIDDVKLQKAFDETINKNGLSTKESHPGDHHHEKIKKTGDHHTKLKKPGIPKPETNAPEAKVIPTPIENENYPTPTHEIDYNIKEVSPGYSFEKKSQEWYEYESAWKNQDAGKFINGDFGKPVGSDHFVPKESEYEWERNFTPANKLDLAEMNHREFLRERLINAQNLIGKPEKHETINHFLYRFNNENADISKHLYNELGHEGLLTGNSDYKSKVWSAIEKMPSEMKKIIADNFNANREVAIGYVKAFSGNKESVVEGIKGIFGFNQDINPESIKIKPDGSILYENAFGKNNYDLQISKDKVGVDGPLFNNMKKTGLSLDSIKNAKSFIIEGPVSKTVAEATMDMSKGGEVGGGKKDLDINITTEPKSGDINLAEEPSSEK